MIPSGRAIPARGAVRDAGGFTLIEVVIVVVIVGILMAVALPAYQGSLQKGRRSDAKSALLDAANRQEQFMLDRSTYTSDMRDLGFTLNPSESEERYYTVSAAACAGGSIATCFVLTATPRAGSVQVDDTRCTSFSLDSAGAKTATGSTASECW